MVMEIRHLWTIWLAGQRLPSRGRYRRRESMKTATLAVALRKSLSHLRFAEGLSHNTPDLQDRHTEHKHRISGSQGTISVPLAWSGERSEAETS